jgi:hypothetical protein
MMVGFSRETSSRVVADRHEMRWIFLAVGISPLQRGVVSAHPRTAIGYFKISPTFLRSRFFLVKYTNSSYSPFSHAFSFSTKHPLKNTPTSFGNRYTIFAC